MANGFRRVDREQSFLLPPDMADWLAADHLVWFVLDSVAVLDLAAFRVRYRLGGAGRAAYDPQMMLGLLVYAYAVGQRSSRQIERLCHVDVAFRVACAQDVPDHATIARFRAEHEQALGGLLEQILVLCARAGMGRLGTVALDGTKIAAAAALSANRTESALRRIATEILGEAADVDAAEDGLFGQSRGDELPAGLARREGRQVRIRRMVDDLAAERTAAAAGSERAQRAARRVGHARAKLAETRRQVAEQARARAEREAAASAAGTGICGAHPTPVEQRSVVRRDVDRLVRAEAAAAAARHPEPAPAGSPGETQRNLTDPDSRIMKTRTGWVQGYNGQLAVSADYLIVAAEVTNDTTDHSSYQPMITAGLQAVAAVNTATDAGWAIGTVLADAGYASTANLTADGPDRLIALGNRRDLAAAAQARPAHGDLPGDATPRQRMDHRLRTADGAALYKRRAATVEPVNAHLKDRRGLRRFARRGLSAANSEFRFAAAVTNLLRIRTLQPA